MWDCFCKAGALLEPFEVIISFITMIFAGYASFRLLMQNRRLKELARSAPKIENFQDKITFYEGVQTPNPIALALSLVPQAPSIKKDVERFLNTMGWKMEVDEINMNGINSPSDIEILINRLREKRHLLDLQGNTEVHLFLQGPVVSGILLGAMFDHWKPVKLWSRRIMETFSQIALVTPRNQWVPLRQVSLFIRYQTFTRRLYGFQCSYWNPEDKSLQSPPGASAMALILKNSVLHSWV